MYYFIGPDEEYPTNCVYFLRPLVAARLFKTLVGSEKVSAQNIAINIFQKVPDERYSDVTISTELYGNYNSLEGFLKENMCWSLLLVIAFRELILLNNPKALAIVSQRSIKKV
uniref:Uncharacterized protein n=1 Tax=Clastoptera arizonana TaxID=38151 RepID=A0A1B6D079_9HEMI